MFNYVEIYTDGACEPNPGQMGVGFFIVHGADTLCEYHASLGHGTSNIAEFSAAILALEKALSLGLTEEKIVLYSDSALLVNILNNKWKAKLPHLKELSGKAKRLMFQFQDLTVEWIERESNSHADNLSKIDMVGV